MNMNIFHFKSISLSLSIYICIFFSNIFLNMILKTNGKITGIIYMELYKNYIYIYSQVHKYWDIDTVLTFLALYTTTMDFKWNEQDVL